MTSTEATAHGAALQLSPSVVHRRLMRQIEPELAFGGGLGTDRGVGSDASDVPGWQAALRAKLRELLGLDVMPDPPVSLNVRELWAMEHELGTVQKLVFTAEPGADVPCYQCIPRGAEPPYPVFICLQGHNTGMHHSIAADRETEREPDVPEGDRDFALGCLRRGVAALCIEQRSFGERREQEQEEVSEHGCHDAAMHALMLGRTLAGERVYDVDRGIDLLAARGDIDMGRLGVMGNSGGGLVATYAAAMLDRVTMAMPSCSFATHAGSIMSIYHCADNYIPSLLRYAGAADVAGLIAPRPLVIVNGKDDPIFPIDAAREAFERVRRIYRAAGHEDRCHHVIGDGGHRFYAEDAWDVMLPYLR